MNFSLIASGSPATTHRQNSQPLRNGLARLILLAGSGSGARTSFRSSTSICASNSTAFHCAASATVGGVTASNELPATAESPYPR
jgi:hypothetical protein